MLKILDKIIDNRCDDIGLTVCEDKEHIRLFDNHCEALDAVRAKLSPGDQTLADQLEETHADLMGHVERKYYLVGLLDGFSINNKSLAPAGADIIHVAS
jgi:hypothetical protein